MDSNVLNTAHGARWYRIPWCRRHKRLGFNLWVRKIPWRKKRQPTPVFLPGKSHQRSLVGYSPWGRNESDVTEHTHTHTHTQQQQQHAEHLSWSSGFPLLHTYITRAVSLVPTLSWFFLRSIECQCTGKILLEDTSSPPVPSCLWLPVLCSLPLAHTWQFHENSGWHLACWYGNPIFLLCSARSESVLVPSFWGGSCLYVHFRLGGSPALSVLWWAQTRPDLVDYPSWPCGYPSFPCWGESDTVFSFLHLNTWVV